MPKYPSKKLIQETKALIRLNLFLRDEIGLEEEFSTKELKQLLYVLKTKKRLK